MKFTTNNQTLYKLMPATHATHVLSVVLYCRD